MNDPGVAYVYVVMEEWERLRPEFDAEPDTFLERLQTSATWDAAAFERLCAMLRQACEVWESHEVLPRWLVAGSWYVTETVPALINEPDFVRRYPDAYYERSCLRLSELNAWLVYGIRPLATGGSPSPPGRSAAPTPWGHVSAFVP